MRGSIAKNINQLVKNEEVITPEENIDEKSIEQINNFSRRKKTFWKKLSHIEKSKRTANLKKGESK